MDEKKLKKLEEELEKARAKLSEWTERVKNLERKYKGAENTCIHEMVHAADLTPEELAVIIRRAKAGDFDRRGEWPDSGQTEEEVFIDE